MSKIGIEVAYHIHADKTVVNEIVAKHGSKFAAAIKVQQEEGLVDQGYFWSNGHCVIVHGKSAAERNGHVFKPGLEILIFGIPDDCEMAECIRESFKKDASARFIDFANLEIE